MKDQVDLDSKKSLNFNGDYPMAYFPKNQSLRFYGNGSPEIFAIRDDIGSSNNRSIRLNWISNYTTGSSANLNVSGANNVLKSTSSRKYKESVEPLDVDRAFQFFEEAEPVWYRGIGSGDEENFSYYGYIAEDLEVIEPRLIQYNTDNRPEGVMYDKITAFLHTVMYEKFKEYDKAIEEVDELKDEVERLKVKLRRR